MRKIEKLDDSYIDKMIVCPKKMVDGGHLILKKIDGDWVDGWSWQPSLGRYVMGIYFLENEWFHLP